MNTIHALKSTIHDEAIIFTCDEDSCGRHLAITRDTGDLVVFDQGDPDATHTGTSGDVITTVTAGATQ